MDICCISVAVGCEMLLVSLDLIVPFFTMVRFQADIRNIIQQSFATYTWCTTYIHCTVLNSIDDIRSAKEILTLAKFYES